MRNSEEIMKILEQLKREKGLSISEIARRTNMAKSTISRYFNGTREFPVNKVNDFAKVFDVSPEYILGVDQNEVVAAHMDDDLTEEEILKVQAYIAGLKANRK